MSAHKRGTSAFALELQETELKRAKEELRKSTEAARRPINRLERIRTGLIVCALLFTVAVFGAVTFTSTVVAVIMEAKKIHRDTLYDVSQQVQVAMMHKAQCSYGLDNTQMNCQFVNDILNCSKVCERLKINPDHEATAAALSHWNNNINFAALTGVCNPKLDDEYCRSTVRWVLHIFEGTSTFRLFLLCSFACLFVVYVVPMFVLCKAVKKTNAKRQLEQTRLENGAVSESVQTATQQVMETLARQALAANQEIARIQTDAMAKSGAVVLQTRTAPSAKNAITTYTPDRRDREQEEIKEDENHANGPPEKKLRMRVSQSRGNNSSKDYDREILYAPNLYNSFAHEDSRLLDV